jgi:hypothetical protein
MTMHWRSSLPVLALAVLAVFALALADGSAAGQQNEEHHVTLYEDIDFGGQSLILHKDIDNLVNKDFNDIASSVKWHLPKDMAEVLYMDADYKIPLLVLVGKGHLSDLRKIADANDSISSVAFVPCPVGGNPKGIGVDVPRMGQR